MGGECAKCGNTKEPELDHEDPADKVSHKIWSWTAMRIVEEAMKCQLLCKPCHEAKTFAQSGHSGHGITAYKRRGCRCEICLVAKRKEARAYRERRRVRERSQAPRDDQTEGQ